MEASVWFSGWISAAFLGFERLMQAFRIAPALHHAAGELVDDDDLVVLDDVVAVALEHLVRLERLVDVMDDRDVLDVVERPALEQIRLPRHLLDALVAGFGQRHLLLLLVQLEVGLLQLRDQRIDGDVQVGAVFHRAGDDERRARLVDQDRVRPRRRWRSNADAAPCRRCASSCCRADSRSRTRCWCRRSRRRRTARRARGRPARARCSRRSGPGTCRPRPSTRRRAWRGSRSRSRRGRRVRSGR